MAARALGPLSVAHSAQWRFVTAALQLAACVTLLGHVVDVIDLDSPTSSSWQWLARQPYVQSAMFEAWVAALSFLLWILWFRALHMVAWVRTFRIVPRDLKSDLVADLARAVANVRSLSYRQSRALRVYASFPVYLGGIWLIHWVKPPRPLEAEPPSFNRFAAELALGIFAYDFCEYWLHLGMHKCPNAWRGLQLCHRHMAVHHEIAVKDEYFLEPEAVVNHSFVDGLQQVVVNIIVQNLPLLGVPKHKLSRIAHNILVTYLLTESHAGLDLPWGSHRLCPQLLGGAPRHEAHHRWHSCCYHQFFKYLDDFFGYVPPVNMHLE